MKRMGIVSLLLLGLAACGGGDEEIRKNETVTPHPTEVKGSLTGRVLDAFHKPLTTATVKVDVGSAIRSSSVNEHGYFTIAKLPAGGTLDVRIEATGFVAAAFQAGIPAEAGEFPQNEISVDTGDIVLFPASDVIEFEVLSDWAERLLIKEARCHVSPAWGSTSLAVGEMYFAAEAAEGVLRCGGVPPLSLLAAHDGRVRISFPAQDVDGDGVPDHAGGEWEYTAEDLYIEGVPAISLSVLGYDLKVVATNTPLLKSGFPLPGISPDADVEILFDHPVEVVDLEVTDQSNGKSVEASATSDGPWLRIRPGSKWGEGQVYRYRVFVQPVGWPRRVLTYSAEFFVASSGALEVAATIPGPATEVLLGNPVELHFSEWIYGPNGPRDFSVQFNHDLDENGEIGNAPYELGNSTSLSVIFAGGELYGNWAVFDAPQNLPVGIEIHLLLDGETFFDTSGALVGSLTTTLEVEEE